VADQGLELGYRAVKLHAWGDARRDAELAQDSLALPRPSQPDASNNDSSSPPAIRLVSVAMDARMLSESLSQA